MRGFNQALFSHQSYYHKRPDNLKLNNSTLLYNIYYIFFYSLYYLYYYNINGTIFTFFDLKLKLNIKIINNNRKRLVMK